MDNNFQHTIRRNAFAPTNAPMINGEKIKES